jgi:hypothetical protein
MPGVFTTHRYGGAGHFRHTVVSATLVKAGSHRVLPLDAEKVRHSDGRDQQDCEGHAAKRLLARLRQEHPQLPLMLGGDALYCHEPFVASYGIWGGIMCWWVSQRRTGHSTSGSRR